MSQMKAYNFLNPGKNSDSTFKSIFYWQTGTNTGDMSVIHTFSFISSQLCLLIVALHCEKDK